MASDDSTIRNEAIKELARRELERRRNADPVGRAAKKVGGAKAPNEDPLAYRGQLLPLGKTQEGNIVPAMPQFAYDAAKMTKKAMQGEQFGAGEALKAGMSFGPVGAASRRASGSLLPSREGMPQIPTAEAINDAKRAAYKASEDAGITVAPAPFESMVRALVPELKKSGFDVGMTPGAANMITRLAKEVGEGKSKTLEELDTLRKLARSNANEASRKGNDTDLSLNVLIKDKIDEFIEEQTGGNSGLKQARELAMRASKAEEIDDIMERSITKAGEYRASGMENAWRAEFKKLADNKKKMARYTKEEQDAIKEAGRTESGMQRGLITLGKFSPTAGAIGMLLTASAMGHAPHDVHTYLSNPALMGLPVAGLIARYAATKMREKSVDVLQGLVKGGKPMSDYRVQQAMRGRSMGADLQRAGLMGAGGMMSAGQPAQPEFNPLLNPNQL